MSELKVVLLEQDDLMHSNTGESNFNESAYYNFFDRGQLFAHTGSGRAQIVEAVQMRRIVPEQPRKRLHLASNQRIFHFYFARDDSHHVGNHPRLELARAFGCRHEFAVDKIGGRFEQFN